MKAPPAIGFHYRSSRLLVFAVVVLAILAVVAVWFSAAPHWLHLALSFLIVAYAVAALGNMLRPHVHSLLWRADGSAELALNDRVSDGRREAQGAVSGARTMGPLIVLTLRWPPREREHLWLLPDNLDADTRRRLRMRLAAGTGAAVASGNADSD